MNIVADYSLRRLGAILGARGVLALPFCSLRTADRDNRTNLETPARRAYASLVHLAGQANVREKWHAVQRGDTPPGKQG